MKKALTAWIALMLVAGMTTLAKAEDKGSAKGMMKDGMDAVQKKAEKAAMDMEDDVDEMGECMEMLKDEDMTDEEIVAKCKEMVAEDEAMMEGDMEMDMEEHKGSMKKGSGY